MKYVPHVETRPDQHYAGLRVQVPISEMGVAISKSLDEVFAWLGAHGIQPAGPPFVRYWVINMPGLMQIENCVPIAAPIPSDGRVSPGVLPSGRYAALTFTGLKPAVEANAALLDWAAAQGIAWDVTRLPEGDAFGARYETYFTDPAREPDPEKWLIEIAIRLADK